MEYILYYNDKQKGYGFYETNVSLSQTDQDELQKICNDVAEPVKEAVELRYSPFRDERYLLSVIFRQPNGVGNLLRGTNSVAHILLTEEKADNFFSAISLKALYEVVRYAADLLEGTGAQLRVPDDFLSEQPGKIPVSYLLSAASYAGTPSLNKQAYFGIQTSAWQEVVAMLKNLPVRLRKRISFHTGIQSVQESKGIAVSFCSAEMLGKAWRSGMTGGMSNTDKFLYVIDSSGNCEHLKEDESGLNKSRALLDVLDRLPCEELTYPQLVENASSWEELDKLLELNPRERSMDAMVRLIPADVLLQQVRSNHLKESTMEWLCRSEMLPEEVFSAIVQNEKVAGETLSRLVCTGWLSEERILYVIDSGKLEEKDLYEMVGFAERKGMKQVAKILHKALQSMQASATRQEEILEVSLRQPVRKRSESSVSHIRNIGAVATILNVLVKLVPLVAMLWGGVALIKSLVSIKGLAVHDYIYLTIDANLVGLLWKVLALILLSAAASAYVTYHIMKRKPEGERKKKGKPIH